jgi:Na+:H+ antiporter, NhaA family
VMFGVVPLFGFASAGVPLDSGPAVLLQPLSLGIVAGLFLGKQVGIFGAVWLAVRAGVVPQPRQTNWTQIYGAALLCGIGFTMSLFIGALAFPGDPLLVDQARVGTLAGSLLSAIAGYVVLRLASPEPSTPEDLEDVEELFGADQPD